MCQASYDPAVAPYMSFFNFCGGADVTRFCSLTLLTSSDRRREDGDTQGAAIGRSESPGSLACIDVLDCIVKYCIVSWSTEDMKQRNF